MVKRDCLKHTLLQLAHQVLLAAELRVESIAHLFVCTARISLAGPVSWHTANSLGVASESFLYASGCLLLQISKFLHREFCFQVRLHLCNAWLRDQYSCVNRISHLRIWGHHRRFFRLFPSVASLKRLLTLQIDLVAIRICIYVIVMLLRDSGQNLCIYNSLRSLVSLFVQLVLLSRVECV